MLDCTHPPLVNFKQNLLVQLQQKILRLTVDDLTPLLLLESMLNKEFVPIQLLPHHINCDIQCFGRRNLWHGIFPASLSQWIQQKHGPEAWLIKFSAQSILALHGIWIECCTISHECTTRMIRVEDHETFQSNVLTIFCICTDLPLELEQHRESVAAIRMTIFVLSSASSTPLLKTIPLLLI